MTTYVGDDRRSASRRIDVSCFGCRRLVWVAFNELVDAQDLRSDSSVVCVDCAVERGLAEPEPDVAGARS